MNNFVNNIVIPCILGSLFMCVVLNIFIVFKSKILNKKKLNYFVAQFDDNLTKQIVCIVDNEKTEHSCYKMDNKNDDYKNDDYKYITKNNILIKIIKHYDYTEIFIYIFLDNHYILKYIICENNTITSALTECVFYTQNVENNKPLILWLIKFELNLSTNVGEICYNTNNINDTHVLEELYKININQNRFENVVSIPRRLLKFKGIINETYDEFNFDIFINKINAVNQQFIDLIEDKIVLKNIENFCNKIWYRQCINMNKLIEAIHGPNYKKYDKWKYKSKYIN